VPGRGHNYKMASINSKKREAGKLSKRYLTLDEKINILDEVKKRKLSCRAIADKFNIGKTQAANVLKNESTLRKEYEIFQGKGFKHLKRENHQKFKAINEILYVWYKKCEASGIYVNGPLLKEEATNIKQSLNRPELDGFKASDGWLEKWKVSHGIKEKQISGESLDVSQATVESWMERIRELCKDYDQRDIWNMDESGCFFKALPSKGLARKGKKTKGGKKSKQRITVAFFVSADGAKVGKPIVIWRSKKPRCFKSASAPDTLGEVSYFDDPKSWMQVHIMENILDTLNRQMVKEGRKVMLLLDNATVHPPSLIDMYSNIKIVFLPKNTTSRLQPLDAGIIQSFKSKYRKKLMRYVIARAKENLLASEIAKGVNVLQAIAWVADAWKEVSANTIKNCFAKCGIVTARQNQSEEDTVDEEFDALFKELTAGSECDMTAEEYIGFDVETGSSLPAINADMVDWRVSSVQSCVAEYLKKESGEDLVVSDSDDEDGDKGGEDGEEVEDGEVEVSTEEALSMIDKLVNLKDLDKDERKSLVLLKEKLEKIKINSKIQKSIKDYFK